MATKTFEELKQLAIQIRDEKTNKQNTATRVGTAMLEHINKLEQDYYDKTKTDEELKERDDKLTELDNRIINITGFGFTGKDSGASHSGDIYYNVKTNLLRKRIDDTEYSSYETVPFSFDTVYMCKGVSYEYNGSKLLPSNKSIIDWDSVELVLGGIDFSNGNEIPGNNRYRSGFIKNKEQIYYIPTGYKAKIAYYDDDKQYLGMDDNFQYVDVYPTVYSSYHRIFIGKSDDTDISNDEVVGVQEIQYLYCNADIDIQQGGINSSTGEFTETNSRCRVTINTTQKTCFIIEVNEGISYNISKFNQDTYNGLHWSSFKQGKNTLEVDENSKIVIVFAKNDFNLPISPLDIVPRVKYLFDGNVKGYLNNSKTESQNKNGINYVYTKIQNLIQGGIDDSDGSHKDTNTRLKTDKPILFKQGDTITINEGIVFNAGIYDADGTYKGLLAGGFKEGEYIVQDECNLLLFFAIKTNFNIVINPEEVHCYIKHSGYIDDNIQDLSNNTYIDLPKVEPEVIPTYVGTINWETGEDEESGNKTLRSDFINYFYGKILIPKNYIGKIAYYNHNRKFISLDSDFSTDNLIPKIKSDLIRFIIKRSDGTDIENNEVRGRIIRETLYLKIVKLHQGGINSEDGSFIDNINRCRTDKLDAKNIKGIRVNDGINFSAIKFNREGVFEGFYFNGWQKKEQPIIYDGYLVLYFAKFKDSQAISTLDVQATLLTDNRQADDTDFKVLDYVNSTSITSSNEWSGKIPNYEEIISLYDSLLGEYDDINIPADYGDAAGSGFFPYKYKVNKELLGKDQSNTYDIYSYVFSPTEYKHTTIWHCVMHGVEEQTTLAMYQLLKNIVDYDDVAKNTPVLDYIRRNVRIVLIPVINPYGLNNRKYGNYNGVNSSRNFPYYWNEYQSTGSEWDNKGTSPFSEKESQILRDIYLKFRGVCDFIIDYHTGENWVQDPMFYYDNTDDLLREALFEAASIIINDKLSKSYETFETSRALNLFYGNRCLHIPYATIEYGTRAYSEIRNSSEQLSPLMWNYICYWTAIFNRLINKQKGNSLIGFVSMTEADYNNLPYKDYNTIYKLDSGKKYIGDIEL